MSRFIRRGLGYKMAIWFAGSTAVYDIPIPSLLGTQVTHNLS